MPSLRCTVASHREKSMHLLNITHILSAGTWQIFWLEVLKKTHCIFSYVEICLLDIYLVPFMIWICPPFSHSAPNQIATTSTWRINQNSFYTRFYTKSLNSTIHTIKYYCLSYHKTWWGKRGRHLHWTTPSFTLSFISSPQGFISSSEVLSEHSSFDFTLFCLCLTNFSRTFTVIAVACNTQYV